MLGGMLKFFFDKKLFVQLKSNKRSPLSNGQLQFLLTLTFGENL